MVMRSLGSWMLVCLPPVLSGCSGPESGALNASMAGRNGSDVGALFTDGGTAAAGPCAPSPANFEVPGNGCDDNANGQVDEVAGCDTGLPIEGSAAHFARAIGICQMADAQRWGLVAASYTSSYGVATEPHPAQHGILPKFGATIKPREGAALGVLSSGYAREFNGPAAEGAFQLGLPMTGPGRAPPGFPKPAAGCQIANEVEDVVTVKLQIKTPANARGLSFDFNFFSGEWPEWVCSRFNDSFVALLTSRGFNGGVTENISFDAQKNPVSVNNGFFDRCTPGTTTGCSGEPPVLKRAACAGGENELLGTGFERRAAYCGAVSTGGGATGWLTSQAPVLPNETITLELIIWDTGDGNYDSSVLLDSLRWEAGQVTQPQTSRPAPK